MIPNVGAASISYFDNTANVSRISWMGGYRYYYLNKKIMYMTIILYVYHPNLPFENFGNWHHDNLCLESVYMSSYPPISTTNTNISLMEYMLPSNVHVHLCFHTGDVSHGVGVAPWFDLSFGFNFTNDQSIIAELGTLFRRWTPDQCAKIQDDSYNIN